MPALGRAHWLTARKGASSCLDPPPLEPPGPRPGSVGSVFQTVGFRCRRRLPESSQAPPGTAESSQVPSCRSTTNDVRSKDLGEPSFPEAEAPPASQREPTCKPRGSPSWGTLPCLKDMLPPCSRSASIMSLTCCDKVSHKLRKGKKQQQTQTHIC